MKQHLLRRAGLGIALAALTAVQAQAANATVTPTVCTAPALSQPFLAWGDSNWYVLAGGQSADNFDGGGWVLSGGAKIVAAKLADGQTGSVLDLPAGSSAQSPTLCVTSDYSSARAMVSNRTGSDHGYVAVSVSYAGTGSARNPQTTGKLATTGGDGANGAWQPSDAVALDPASTPGWQLLRITLTPGGSRFGKFDLYDLYLDPNARD